MPIDRDRKLTIRIAEEELAMLGDLADADGVSGSDWVRLQIRREHAARFEMPIPRPRVKR